MRTGFLITARLKSTRLPLKLIREVEGRPIFSHMIDRVKLTKSADQIVVCTSTNPQDDPLEEIAEKEGVACFRGDEDDVVKRLCDAASLFGFDYLLSVTGDCPFTDPNYADLIVKAFLETKADFIRALDLPHGVFNYGVNPASLRKVLEIKDQNDSEVWGRYFTDTDLFKVYDLPIDNPFHHQPQLRMTLDYPEDLEFFKAVFAALYVPGKVFSLDEIITFLTEHPEVAAINYFRQAEYVKRWTGQSWIKLKPRYEVKRAVLIGSGSNTSSHANNLANLGVEELATLAVEKQDASVDLPGNVKRVRDWNDLETYKPDVAIITDSTRLRGDRLKSLLSVVRGIFVEPPVAYSSEAASELLELIESRKVTTFVGYHLRSHPAIKAIRAILDNGQIGQALVFQVNVGQSKNNLTETRDILFLLSHELNLSEYLLGPVRRVTTAPPSPDLAVVDLMMQHLNGAVSQIHLDMIQRLPQRKGTLSFEEGWITYDLSTNSVQSQAIDQASPTTVWQSENHDMNDSRLEQIRMFINCVREGRIRHEYDAWRAASTISVIEAAVSSSQSGRLTDVSSSTPKSLQWAK